MAANSVCGAGEKESRFPTASNRERRRDHGRLENTSIRTATSGIRERMGYATSGTLCSAGQGWPDAANVCSFEQAQSPVSR